MNIDHAYSAEAFSLDDKVGLLGGDQDPGAADDGTIPVGSLYLSTTGTVSHKWRMPSTWIEVSRWPFRFTAARASALDYVPTSVNDKILQYTLPVDCVVVGMFCQAGSISKGSVDVELWLDGQQHAPATITLPESAAPVYGSALNLAADMAAGGQLQIRMAETVGVAKELIVTVLVAQRSG